jgi:hypothetical protein
LTSPDARREEEKWRPFRRKIAYDSGDAMHLDLRGRW